MLDGTGGGEGGLVLTCSGQGSWIVCMSSHAHYSMRGGRGHLNLGGGVSMGVMDKRGSVI